MAWIDGSVALLAMTRGESPHLGEELFIISSLRQILVFEIF